MIALTGTGGFIGSVILGYLNKQGITDVYCFDDLPAEDQYKNLLGKQYLGLHSTKEIITDIRDFNAVIHFGANSSTLEKNWSSIYETNVLSTRRWHDLCRKNNTKFTFSIIFFKNEPSSVPNNFFANQLGTEPSVSLN